MQKNQVLKVALSSSLLFSSFVSTSLVQTTHAAEVQKTSVSKTTKTTLPHSVKVSLSKISYEAAAVDVYQQKHNIGTLKKPDNDKNRALKVANRNYVLLASTNSLNPNYLYQFMTSTTNDSGVEVFTKSAAKYATTHLSQDAKNGRKYFNQSPSEVANLMGTTIDKTTASKTVLKDSANSTKAKSVNTLSKDMQAKLAKINGAAAKAVSYQLHHKVGTVKNPDNSKQRALAAVNRYNVLTEGNAHSKAYLYKFMTTTTGDLQHNVYTKTAAKYAVNHISADSKAAQKEFVENSYWVTQALQFKNSKGLI